ncbi:hypothetical protein SSX86_001684 [Deinandra increscens subsp. villosa]|uniref:Transmembrane protein n=1 Tax=Deinandra increscens subsp. villosa TaxID=3103831 RepID=A0AAP0HB17_9ASTR
MDQEQEEIQFLGFFGIFKETFKIISTYKQIFTQITLSIILPLSFIFLAHIQVSEYLFGEILRHEYDLDQTPKNTNRYNSLSDLISSEWTYFWLFKATYFIFFFILSLISTSAIVYTIACIYTSKNTSFKSIISVVPKVWKRLMVTFVWNVIIVCVLNLVVLLVFIIWAALLGFSTFGVFILSIIGIVYLSIFIYISVIWHLASVISVLEEDYGIRAMLKSKELIKGKTIVSIAIYSFLNLCFIGLQMGFEWHVVLGEGSIMIRSIDALIFFFLLSFLILFSLTAQTIIYFICKSFHHQNIDKTLLADHLEVCLGDYLPLKSKDIQLENFDT